MITRMFTIHDTAVKAFVSPHFAKTHGEAERNFKSAVNDEKNGHLYNSPENFTLYYIGDYDDETGLVKVLSAPQSVITASQCKNPDNVRALGT